MQHDDRDEGRDGGRHDRPNRDDRPGNWGASAADSGQRPGPVDVEPPFERGQGSPADGAGADQCGGVHMDGRSGCPPARSAAGTSYGGWSGAGSAQARWSEVPPPGVPAAPAGPAESGQPGGPKGMQRSDERIHDDVCGRLSREPGLDAGDVAVAVREFRVTLTGTVADRPTKHAIELLVDCCYGVREIDNRIKVMRDGLPPHPDAPPTPRRWVPRDSPTALDEAAGRHTEPSLDASGRYS
jgi:hypothetical protein